LKKGAFITVERQGDLRLEAASQETASRSPLCGNVYLKPQPALKAATVPVTICKELKLIYYIK